MDITSFLNELNLKLQGKSNLVGDFFRNINIFRKKLVLFDSQIKAKKFSHFKHFEEVCSKQEKVDFSFPSEIVKQLKENFAKRFLDLENIKSEIMLFENPFGCESSDAPNELQLELIELQENTAYRRKFSDAGLLEFYSCLPNGEFPLLLSFAAGMASMFGSTYLCEQTFSRLKIVKSKYRTNLTDGHLETVLTIGEVTLFG